MSFEETIQTTKELHEKPADSSRLFEIRDRNFVGIDKEDGRINIIEVLDEPRVERGKNIIYVFKKFLEDPIDLEELKRLAREEK